MKSGQPQPHPEPEPLPGAAGTEPIASDGERPEPGAPLGEAGVEESGVEPNFVRGGGDSHPQHFRPDYNPWARVDPDAGVYFPEECSQAALEMQAEEHADVTVEIPGLHIPNAAGAYFPGPGLGESPEEYFGRLRGLAQVSVEQPLQPSRALSSPGSQPGDVLFGKLRWQDGTEYLLWWVSHWGRSHGKLFRRVFGDMQQQLGVGGTAVGRLVIEPGPYGKAYNMDFYDPGEPEMVAIAETQAFEIRGLGPTRPVLRVHPSVPIVSASDPTDPRPGRSIFRFTKCEDVVVRDLIVDGNGAARGLPRPDQTVRYLKSHNLYFLSCSRVRLTTVQSDQAGGVGIFFGRVLRSGVDPLHEDYSTDIILEWCVAEANAYIGLAAQPVHRLRVRGGRYAMTDLASNRVGISLEPGHEVGYPAPPVYDVKIYDGVRIEGNWKGCFLNGESRAGFITIENCSFVGVVPGTMAVTCSDPGLGSSPDCGLGYYDGTTWKSGFYRAAVAIDSSARWVLIQNCSFQHYDTEQRVSHGVVLLIGSRNTDVRARCTLLTGCHFTGIRSEKTYTLSRAGVSPPVYSLRTWANPIRIQANCGSGLYVVSNDWLVGRTSLSQQGRFFIRSDSPFTARNNTLVLEPYQGMRIVMRQCDTGASLTDDQKRAIREELISGPVPHVIAPTPYSPC